MIDIKQNQTNDGYTGLKVSPLEFFFELHVEYSKYNQHNRTDYDKNCSAHNLGV